MLLLLMMIFVPQPSTVWWRPSGANGRNATLGADTASRSGRSGYSSTPPTAAVRAARRSSVVCARVRTVSCPDLPTASSSLRVSRVPLTGYLLNVILDENFNRWLNGHRPLVLPYVNIREVGKKERGRETTSCCTAWPYIFATISLCPSLHSQSLRSAATVFVYTTGGPA